ncbi:MAG: sodium:proton antiporter [Gammaproteobacteria bacterium RIFCSPHIGHO2_12_FULL_35_23]|nr:MAG: sodium:proton antiporter [Gammaproteobacteria bacterium RIFCSPHIGHO2_12_FULL_35_23]
MAHIPETAVFVLFLIFFGAAAISTLALFTRQSMLVGYLVLGALLGPYGFKLIPKSGVIDQAGTIGIVFLLFLLGLHLHPQKLIKMFSRTIWVAVMSSVIFLGLGYGICKLFGYSQTDALVIGLAMMFSSTIIGLKLLPTTILHHQHTGEIVISVLLLQDLIAIITILLLSGMDSGHLPWQQLILIIISLPVLLLIAYIVQRFILIKLLAKFDRVQEYIFLISIGWCLGMAQLAASLGLSAEIGAFIAGVAVATHPISRYIAENLKPLRDFFLVLFFFSIGAHFDLDYIDVIWAPAILMAIVMLVLKPLVFRILLAGEHESKSVAWEVGWRLGQTSEFSLLIAYLAGGSNTLGEVASYLIQATTILTFIASSYIVVLRYPTPLAFSEKLRRD